MPVPVGPPRPDVDDGLAVDVDDERATAEPAAGEQPGEDADDVGEPRVGGPLNAARQTLFSTKERHDVMELTMPQRSADGANR